MNKNVNWHDIAQLDPYLAGSIAARGHEWWEESTAESEATSAGLTGDRRADFLRGWNAQIAEQEAERSPQRILFEEYEQAGKDYIKGDPAR